MALNASGGGSAGAIRAGGAFVEVWVKNNVSAGLDRVAAKLRAFSKMTTKIGGITAAAGGALLAPLAALFKGGLDMAGQMQDLQDQFGLTAEAVSKLGFVAEVAGAGLDELEVILKGLAKTNTTGKPLDEAALDLADALLKIEDPSERARVAMELLGKGGLKFLRVAGDMRRLFGEAPITDQATLDASDAFGQSLNKIFIFAKASLLPFARYAAMAAESIANFTRENAHLLKLIVPVGVGLVGIGAALVALGTAAFGVSVALSGLSMGAAIAAKAMVLFWTAATGPVGLFVIGMTAAAAALVYFGGLGKQTLAGLAEGWAGAFASMGETATSTFEGVVTALQSGELALAGKIALAGLSLAWEQFWAQLKFTWAKFRGEFTGGWGDVGDSISLVWNNVFSGMKLIFSDFTAFLRRQFSAVAHFIADIMKGLLDLIDRPLRAAEAAASHFGDAKIAKTLRAGIATARAGLDFAAGQTPAEINAERDKHNQGILDQNRAREQEIIDRGKRAAGAAPQLDKSGINAAATLLSELLAEAARNLSKKEKKEEKKPGASVAAEVAAASRVAFLIAKDARGQFGTGDAVNKQILDTSKKQLAEAMAANDNLATIATNTKADVIGLTVV